jgi:hypothetical protein
MNHLLFILISSLTCLAYPFTLHIQNHYSNIAANIFNVNDHLKNNQNAFNSISYYNKNNTICFNLNHKNNLTYLMKDKYNYIVSFTIFKYKYLMFLKSTPVAYNYTIMDVDIRKKRIDKNLKLNFNHYNRINNIIYKYINHNIITKKNEPLSLELFKYFNNY